MIKRLIIILFIIIVITVFSVMTQDETRIGVFIYDMADFYMINYVDHIENELSDTGELFIHDAMNSQILQNQGIIENIDKLDVLIVNPVDRLSAYALIRLAEQKDKTIIFINREPLSSDLYTYSKAYYVGSQAIQSAEYQAELIAELFGNDPNQLNGVDANKDNKIQLVIFKGQRGHQDAEDRTDYLKTYLSLAGYQVDLVAIQPADWSKEKARIAMTEMLEEETYIEVVACNNDYMALGVIDAIDEYNKVNNKSVYLDVVGIDGMLEAIEAIMEKKMYGTVFNDSRLQVLAVKELLMNELNPEGKNTSDKYIWIDYTQLNINNMNSKWE